MKHWECTDCRGGEKFPCKAFFEYEDTPPTTCPYNGDTDCKWVLVDSALT